MDARFLSKELPSMCLRLVPSDADAEVLLALQADGDATAEDVGEVLRVVAGVDELLAAVPRSWRNAGRPSRARRRPRGSAPRTARGAVDAEDEGANKER
eukprot:14418055-Alexandrium_andersonii.AAC.1